MEKANFDCTTFNIGIAKSTKAVFRLNASHRARRLLAFKLNSRCLYVFFCFWCSCLIFICSLYVLPFYTCAGYVIFSCLYFCIPNDLVVFFASLLKKRKVPKLHNIFRSLVNVSKIQTVIMLIIAMCTEKNVFFAFSIKKVRPITTNLK